MKRSNGLPALYTALIATTLTSGCIESGSSGEFIDPDSDIRYQLSGTLSPSSSVTLDSDLNDILAPYTSNDTIDDAQALANIVTVQGFASASPTQGQLSTDASKERFATTVDQNDYFSVSLQAGQAISLAVINQNNTSTTDYTGDLDLYLLSTAGNLIASSATTNNIEQVSAPSSGEYRVLVKATSGISRYVMGITSASGDFAVRQDEFITGEMVVGYDAGVSTASANQGLSGYQILSRDAHSTRHPNRITFAPLAATTASTTTTGSTLSSSSGTGNHLEKIQTLEAIKAMASQPGVRYAEPNYRRHAFATPNDPAFDRQWHYAQINLPEAWDTSIGFRTDGNDVVVAVIDTGVFMAHPDLVDKLTTDGYDFISTTENSADGDGIDANPDDPGDGTTLAESSWHGTHVSGTVAAATNNSTGVAGVSWGARIMPIRVLGTLGGSSFDISQGILYAAGLANNSGTLPTQKADVINLSLGGESATQAEQDAVQDAIAAGVILVAASGNETTSAPSYPAAFDDVISVSATDINKAYTSYTNFGTTIDVAAPGGDTTTDHNSDGFADGVLSTLVEVTGSNRAAVYAFYEGTSMAAPHVAGVIALMKAVYPALTPDQVNALLARGDLTDDLGDTGRDDFYGYGLINAEKAVLAAAALNDGTVEPPAILQSTPSSLLLTDVDSASFTLSNTGQGTPVITNVATSASWLSVVPDSIEDNGLGSYLVSIDRSGLGNGQYIAQVAITGTDGNAPLNLTITASMTIGTVSTATGMAQQYVIVLDAVTGERVSGISYATASSNGAYKIRVPAGSYLLRSGSDIDLNNQICSSGESCGSYPTLSAPEAIDVTGDRSGLDISVDLLLFTTDSTAQMNDRLDTTAH